MKKAEFPFSDERLADVSTFELDYLYDSRIEPLFWRPEHIEAAGAICYHLPFLYWLSAVAQPGVLVELGTGGGVSYMAFCQAFARLGMDVRSCAIDNWHSDAAYLALERHHRSRFAAFSTLLRMSPEAAIRRFADGSIDLLHLAGSASAEYTERLLDTWMPKLSARAVVLIHGIRDSANEADLWLLWEALRERCPSFEFVHGAGLGVLAVGSQAPASVRRLCALDRADAVTLRNRFALLGERWDAASREPADMRGLRNLPRQHADQEPSLAPVLDGEAHARAEAAGLHDSRSAHEAEIEALRGQLDAARQQRHGFETALAHERHAHAATRSSTFWRISEPARRFLGARPRLRRSLRRVASVLAIPMSETQRDQTAIKAESVAQIIGASALFDPLWYCATYPDVTASALPPALHYALMWADGRSPGPKFDASEYLAQYRDVAAMNCNPLWHYEQHGRSEQRAIAATRSRWSDGRPASIEHASEPPRAARALLDEHFATLRSLRLYPVAGEVRRVTMVADSADPDALAGEFARAIVFSTLLAARLGAGLRVVTRADAAVAPACAEILAIHGVEWGGNIDFVHSDFEGGRDVTVGPEEVYVTTSWSSTYAVRQAANPQRVVYLVQRDERTDYPHGDERLRCSEVLADSRIHFAVGSSTLFAHLTTGPEPAGGVNRNGIAFDPAFPVNRDARRRNPLVRKQRFVFHAQPGRHRTLYWRGLEVLCACIEDGVLDQAKWDFHFVGEGMSPVVLPNGIVPRCHGTLSPRDYVELVSTMDAGLSLTDAAEPGHAALGLAMSGAVVVANRGGAQQSRELDSPNIVWADTDIDSIRRAVEHAITRTGRFSTSEGTIGHDRVPGNWETALKPCLDALCARLSRNQDDV